MGRSEGPAYPDSASRRSFRVAIETFCIVFFVGSALVAFWFAARFPDAGPRTIAGALLHVFAALALGNLIEPAMTAIQGWPVPDPLVASLFLGAFPLLVYIFLACAWLVQTMHGLLTGYR